MPRIFSPYAMFSRCLRIEREVLEHPRNRSSAPSVTRLRSIQISPVIFARSGNHSHNVDFSAARFARIITIICHPPHHQGHGLMTWLYTQLWLLPTSPAILFLPSTRHMHAASLKQSLLVGLGTHAAITEFHSSFHCGDHPLIPCQEKRDQQAPHRLQILFQL